MRGGSLNPDMQPGKRLGHLVILERRGKRERKGAHLLCQCDCGGLIDMPTAEIRTMTECGGNYCTFVREAE